MNDRSDLVSVVIAARNAEEWIASTLKSVLGQTYDSIEIIVVDDGSTDRTAAIVRSLDTRITCVSQSNRGQPCARNRGISLASGEYIAFIDADDLWLPTKVEAQVAAMFGSSYSWAYANAYVMDERGRCFLPRKSDNLPEGQILASLVQRNFISSATPIVRRDALDRVGPFDTDPRRHIGEDWSYWLRLAELYPAAVARSPLAITRSHSGSMTSRMDLKHALKSRLEIIEALGNRGPESIQGVLNVARANTHLDLALVAVGRGELRFARSCLSAAIRIHPSFSTYLLLSVSLLPASLLGLLLKVRKLFRRRQSISVVKVLGDEL